MVSGDGGYLDYLVGDRPPVVVLIRSMPAGLKSSLIQKRIRASENRLAVAPTISGGFSSKRYRKSTRLVQEYPVTGWISRRWEARQNPGCSDKTLTPAITSEATRNSGDGTLLAKISATPPKRAAKKVARLSQRPAIVRYRS